ncbi:MAG TPA: isocitrate/isopropylmalate dehydrogenase family protein, partial [Thermoleophilia bacterium]|nr:isocitrate/isopropylmalate dehydrogenase family protein [Thermoleophilia bacterium]
GSGTRMVKEGRAEYADPSSIMRATVLLLQHIGFADKAARLEKALDVCQLYERRLLATGKKDGATSAQYADYVMKTVEAPDLDKRWQSYQKK